jgi:peptidoglycan/LPS O-acetylase OafA/YrhL
MFHIVTPAWTLSIELSFYLIAPFVVHRHFLLLALSAFALQAIRYQAYHVGWLSYGTDNRFFPFELGLLFTARCSSGQMTCCEPMFVYRLRSPSLPATAIPFAFSALNRGLRGLTSG